MSSMVSRPWQKNSFFSIPTLMNVLSALTNDPVTWWDIRFRLIVTTTSLQIPSYNDWQAVWSSLNNCGWSGFIQTQRIFSIYHCITSTVFSPYAIVPGIRGISGLCRTCFQCRIIVAARITLIWRCYILIHKSVKTNRPAQHLLNFCLYTGQTPVYHTCKTPILHIWPNLLTIGTVTD